MATFKRVPRLTVNYPSRIRTAGSGTSLFNPAPPLPRLILRTCSSFLSRRQICNASYHSPCRFNPLVDMFIWTAHQNRRPSPSGLDPDRPEIKPSTHRAVELVKQGLERKMRQGRGGRCSHLQPKPLRYHHNSYNILSCRLQSFKEHKLSRSVLNLTNLGCMHCMLLFTRSSRSERIAECNWQWHVESEL
jgi:hypothetical protein